MLRSRLLFALFPLLTLALAACGGSPGPGPATPGTPLSATAEGYTGGEGRVAASMLTSLADIASGTITAEGQFSLELPGNLTRDQLGTVSANNPFCASGGLEYSASGWAADFLAPLGVSEGSELTGTLVLSNRASDAVEGLLGYKEVVSVYSIVAMNVSGVCNDADLGRTTTYALELQPGWNYVLQELTDETGTAATFSSVAEVPADVSWQFISVAVTP